MNVVTVFGASGFIGRYIVREIAKTGARVRAAVLDPLGDEMQAAARARAEKAAATKVEFFTMARGDD